MFLQLRLTFKKGFYLKLLRKLWNGFNTRHNINVTYSGYSTLKRKNLQRTTVFWLHIHHKTPSTLRHIHCNTFLLVWTTIKLLKIYTGWEFSLYQLFQINYNRNLISIPMNTRWTMGKNQSRCLKEVWCDHMWIIGVLNGLKMPYINYEKSCKIKHDEAHSSSIHFVWSRKRKATQILTIYIFKIFGYLRSQSLIPYFYSL